MTEPDLEPRSDSKGLCSFPNIPLFLCQEKMEGRKRDPRPGSSQAMKTGIFLQQPGRTQSAEGCRDGARLLSPQLSWPSLNSEWGPGELWNGSRKENRAWAGSKKGTRIVQSSDFGGQCGETENINSVPPVLSSLCI